EALARVEENLVMDAGARTTRRLESHAELAALDRLDRAEGLRKAAVEPPVPLHIRAETDGTAERDDLEDTAERVAFALGVVDSGDHRGLGGGVGAADFRALGAPRQLVAGDGKVAGAGASDLGHVTQRRDAEFGEEPFRHTRDRDAGGRFARARALEHIPDVAMAVFHRPGQVGVAGAGPRDLFLRRARLRNGGAPPCLPVFP